MLMRKAVLWAVVLSAVPARAADHNDAPGVAADPASDLTDLFAWNAPDALRTYVVIDVFPSATAGARFSDAVSYVLHVDAVAKYGDSNPVRQAVICTFDAAQTISCWGPRGEFLTGDASQPAGLSSPSGKIKVFAGLRYDPFFFNLAGMRAGIAAMQKAVPQNPQGCPASAAAMGKDVGVIIGQDGKGGPPADAFSKGGEAAGGNYSGNVLAIVLSLDATLFTDATHPVLGLWAATHRLVR